MTETKAAPKKAMKKAPEAPEKAPKAPKTSSKIKGGLYAVFTTGGKQYRVRAGDKVKIEKLVGDRSEGDTLTFDQVLMTDNGSGEVVLGKPFLSGKSVYATLTKISRYKTIDVIKYKQKSRYFKKYGHRQPYFEIEITEVK